MRHFFQLSQIRKIFSVLSATAAVFLLFFCCGPRNTDGDSFKNWCLRKTDTLWLDLNATRKEFIYTMDEIKNRREEMDSLMSLIKLNPPKNMTEEIASTIQQYNSVLAVYKPAGTEYKNAVVSSEEQFYRIKALEKSIAKNEFEKKTEEFKKTVNELHAEILQNKSRTHEIISKLNSLEPLYLRLQPKIEKLVTSIQN
jgi:hypothetical protein